MSRNPSRKRQLESELVSIDKNDDNNNHGTEAEDVIISNEDNDIEKEEIDLDDTINNNGVEHDDEEYERSADENLIINLSEENQTRNDNNNEDEDIVDIANDDVDDEDDEDDDDDDDDDDTFDYYEYGDYDNYDNDCRLQHAIENDKSSDSILEIIELFPMEIQHINKSGYTPLHTACAWGHNVVMKLIELFPKATQCKDSLGLYPIHVALQRQQYYPLEDIMMKLIDIFPEAVMESTEYGTALHMACSNRSLSAQLIRKVVELNPLAIQEKNDSGRYPIDFAINCKHSIAVIQILLDGDPLGMQRRIDGHLFDSAVTITPFHLACQQRYVDLVEYLMQRSDLQINARDSNGRTSLHYACIYNRDKIVGTILQHCDVDVNATDNFHDTPLHTTLKTINRYEPEKSVHITKILLDHPFVLINQKNDNNQNPLDLIKAHIDNLENYRNYEPSPQTAKILECCIQNVHLLKEFAVKKTMARILLSYQGFLMISFFVMISLICYTHHNNELKIHKILFIIIQ